MPCTTEALLIIGYGNRLRGDDAIGPEAARELQRRGFPAIETHQLTPELADSLCRADRAIFVDADVRLSPGEMRVTRVSTEGGSLDHHVTPASLLRLTEDVYGRSPESILVSIGPESLDLGRPLSPMAIQAVHKLAEEVITRVITS